MLRISFRTMSFRLRTSLTRVSRRLRTSERECRAARRHHRFSRSRDHKSKRPDDLGLEFWAERARTHLFRSKRALALAQYLRARAVFKEAFRDHPTGEKLAALASTAQGAKQFARRSGRQKLIDWGSQLPTSPSVAQSNPITRFLGKARSYVRCESEVVSEYRARYGDAASQIASSMAGRAILGSRILYSSGRRRCMASARASTTVSGSLAIDSTDLPANRFASRNSAIPRRSARRNTPMRQSTLSRTLSSRLMTDGG